MYHYVMSRKYNKNEKVTKNLQILQFMSRLCVCVSVCVELILKNFINYIYF